MSTLAGSLALLIATLLGPEAAAQARSSVVFATTTSTQDTGLLDSLLPPFTRRTGIEVKVIAVGTGAALDMARRGDADAVLVHAPALEREFVQRGDIAGGRLVMHNDFLIVGPPDDPAGGRRAPDLRSVMRAIARTGPFVSRGDGSGTEIRELALWREAQVPPDSVARRVETGQGMGATLNVADQRRAYTLTDRATFLALRERLHLVPIHEGDPSFLNIYHAYVVNPARHPNVKRREGEALVAWLVSAEGQAIIGRYGRERFGGPLFVADAGGDTTAAGVPRGARPAAAP